MKEELSIRLVRKLGGKYVKKGTVEFKLKEHLNNIEDNANFFLKLFGIKKSVENTIMKQINKDKKFDN